VFLADESQSDLTEVEQRWLQESAHLTKGSARPAYSCYPNVASSSQSVDKIGRAAVRCVAAAGTMAGASSCRGTQLREHRAAAANGAGIAGNRQKISGARERLAGRRLPRLVPTGAPGTTRTR
jgi:hypothetical protein